MAKWVRDGEQVGEINLSLFHIFLIVQKTTKVLFQLSTVLGLQSPFNAQRRKTPDYKPAVHQSNTLSRRGWSRCITLASKLTQGLQDTDVCSMPVPLL